MREREREREREGGRWGRAIDGGQTQKKKHRDGDNENRRQSENYRDGQEMTETLTRQAKTNRRTEADISR